MKFNNKHQSIRFWGNPGLKFFVVQHMSCCPSCCYSMKWLKRQHSSWIVAYGPKFSYIKDLGEILKK